MVDAPKSRENVIDMFGVPNVLEKDTIEHNDITSIKVIYNTILDPGEGFNLAGGCLAGLL
jgi:hypothetical protein